MLSLFHVHEADDFQFYHMMTFSKGLLLHCFPSLLDYLDYLATTNRFFPNYINS